MAGSIICMPGWAHPESSLAALADALGSLGSVEVALQEGSTRPVDREPAVLVGWSIGGCVALETAVYHPELVSKLVLIGCTAVFCGTEAYPYGPSPKVLRAMLQGLSRAKREILIGFLELVYSHPSSAGLKQPALDQALLMDDRLLKSGLEYLQNFDLRDKLAGVTAPVLLLHGRDDRLIPWQAAQWLSEKLANSTLCVMEDCDHGLPAARPELAAGAIAKFLSRT